MTFPPAPPHPPPPPPPLLVLAGLPGTGKSTTAEHLTRVTGWPVLSVDLIESALLTAGIDAAQPTGLAAYVTADHLARVHLLAGLPVIIDAVNDHPDARAQWRALAAETGARLLFVELRCPDPTEHRARLDRRRRPLAIPEPTWDSLRERAARLDAWTDPRLILDATRPVRDNVRTILDRLAADGTPTTYPTR